MKPMNMGLVIRLNEVVEAIGRADEERRAFLNIRTGRIVTFCREVLDAAESGGAVQTEDESMVPEAGNVLFSDDYRALPDQFDIDECSIMRRFCETIENDELRRGLLRSLQGRGASMRIKSTVDAFGVVGEWTAFRNEALRVIAIDWLESHGIAFTEE